MFLTQDNVTEARRELAEAQAIEARAFVAYLGDADTPFSAVQVDARRILWVDAFDRLQDAERAIIAALEVRP